jgi:hypothetical protein
MVVQEAANNIGSIGLNNNSRQLAHNIQNCFPSAHRKTNSSDNPIQSDPGPGRSVPINVEMNEAESIPCATGEG